MRAHKVQFRKRCAQMLEMFAHVRDRQILEPGKLRSARGPLRRELKNVGLSSDRKFADSSPITIVTISCLTGKKKCG
jgi:hypothetical protein